MLGHLKMAEDVANCFGRSYMVCVCYLTVQIAGKRVWIA